LGTDLVSLKCWAGSAAYTLWCRLYQRLAYTVNTFHLEALTLWQQLLALLLSDDDGQTALQ